MDKGDTPSRAELIREIKEKAIGKIYDALKAEPLEVQLAVSQIMSVALGQRSRASFRAFKFLGKMADDFGKAFKDVTGIDAEVELSGIAFGDQPKGGNGVN